MEKFIVRIPNEINNQYLEEFLQCKLYMDFRVAEMNFIEYFSDYKPRDFKKKILKNFGTVVWDNIYCHRRELYES